ncbi:hypothetical protein [Anaeromicrobium sediminis]|uniref:SLH domain-containing protein n=1 Tax=Anaeromicrobium sediminis TaxID=1478221 RepID=A0A267MPY2_9FIRM|nr:hypothetical protein [Anaeromicrobium sediminis]PAB60948.1 hypothetical protein CCE28_00510 [Anaeromicrobium sediminis]
MKKIIFIIISILLISFNITYAQSSEGEKAGNKIGAQAGKFKGEADYINGRKKDWEKAILKDYEIISECNLQRETPEYILNFVKGYKDGFKKEYNKNFSLKNINTIKMNVNYIKLKPDKLTGESKDKVFSIDFTKNRFYKDIYLSIKKKTYNIPEKYEKLTSIYEVNMEGYKENIYEPIQVSFDFPYKENVGIYELRDKGWIYLYTKSLDKRSYTDIEKIRYSGGTYALLRDNYFKCPKDINTNWAAEEIYTFTKRGYISTSYDLTYKPEEEMELGEFIRLLDKIDKNDFLMENNISIPTEFGQYGNSIESIIRKKYLKEEDLRKIDPYESLNYKMFEKILKRIPGNSNFSWKEIENKILNEKYKKSESTNVMDIPMKRSEVIYTLYHLEENKII